MGVGLWRPDSTTAYRIRAHIADHDTAWTKATQAKRFTDAFAFRGESLKRPPKGYDADHPLIDDLKRKDFIASTKLTQAQVTSGDFMAVFDDNLERSAPVMRFLCQALDLPF